jgi:hypothetical protein
LMIKDKAESWMESQLTSFSCRKLAQQGISVLTEKHFTDSTEICGALTSGLGGVSFIAEHSPSSHSPSLLCLSCSAVSPQTTANSLNFAKSQYTWINEIDWMPVQQCFIIGSVENKTQDVTSRV